MPGLILAIECAVAGGSLALMEGATMRAKSDPSRSSPSRAEEVLVAIESLLHEGGAALDQIDSVAVSTGPGSYSGIRIGIATALGLRTALGIRCVGVPILPAMALASGHDGEIITAIPVGRKDVAWQIFSEGRSGAARLTPEAEFVAATSGRAAHTVFCHSDLLARMPAPHSPQFTDAGSDLAVMIGSAAAKGRATGDPEPIYLRNTAHTSGF